MPTVTCQCGQRITVGPKAGRETVDCPACGEAVRVNGEAEKAPPLKFGVKVVDRRELEPAVTGRTIAFSCPGCGKEFEESRRAAGKPTQCPKCGAEFVIPAGGVGTAIPREQATVESETTKSAEELRSPTPPARTAEDGVEAAVAAYNAGKASGGKRRMITGGRMVPIGFCLILLGGLVSIVGSVLLVKGSMSALSATGLGGLGGGTSGGLIGPMANYSKLLQELADEPGARRRRPADPQQPLNGVPVVDANQAAKDYQKSLKEQQEKQSSGQAMLIGGVIASGVGMLITFIGGIFLLAGLIGRFLQPQQPVPISAKPGEPGA